MTADKQVIFEFLNTLRQGGSINMFAASPCLQNLFGLDKYEARSILVEWMKTFRSESC